MSANQLKQVLGTTYKTARRLSHRIRAAMRDAYPFHLKGIVEATEANSQSGAPPSELRERLHSHQERRHADRSHDDGTLARLGVSPLWRRQLAGRSWRDPS
jgi:hypothetical protein